MDVNEPANNKMATGVTTRKDKMVQRSLTLSKELEARVVAVAARLGNSKGELMRRLIIKGLRRETPLHFSDITAVANSPVCSIERWDPTYV